MRKTVTDVQCTAGRGIFAAHLSPDILIGVRRNVTVLYCRFREMAQLAVKNGRHLHNHLTNGAHNHAHAW